jgi:uncharacterized membrane protein YgcG
LRWFWSRRLLILPLLILLIAQVYVVGDNFRLVPRSSTRNFTACDAAAAAAAFNANYVTDLLFDTADLRASTKKEKAETSTGSGGSSSRSSSSSSSSSSSGGEHPVFAGLSDCPAPPPPAALVQALLREIQKLDISLCVLVTCDV